MVTNVMLKIGLLEIETLTINFFELHRLFGRPDGIVKILLLIETNFSESNQLIIP